MGYVYAGSETLLNFLEERGDKYYSNTFFEDYVNKISNKFLITYGVSLTKNINGNTKKLSVGNKYNNGVIKTVFQKSFIQRALRMVQNNKLDLFLDSGGFQATMGYLNKRESYLFIDEYYRFLKNYHSLVTNAFTLDLLYTQGEMAHKNEILKINDKSFSTLASLPKHIKDKLIFIYHFRTPVIYSIWKKILKTYQNEFSNYYSMGGIVAFSSTARSTPIHLYIIPLVHIVTNALEQKQNNIKIHVLGGATFKDVFFYKIIQKVVKYHHGLNIEITYDSSAPFKQFQQARVCDFLIPNTFIIQTLSLKEANLKLKPLMTLGVDKPIDEYMFDNYRKMLSEIDPKYVNMINDKPFYYDTEKNGRTVHKMVSLTGMLYIGYQYKILEKICEDYIDEIFPLYENGRQVEFFDLILKKMVLLNRMKLSRKLRKQYKLSKSIETLKTLDLDYIDYIVNYYLSSEEIIDSKEEISGFDFL